MTVWVTSEPTLTTHKQNMPMSTTSKWYAERTGKNYTESQLAHICRFPPRILRVCPKANPKMARFTVAGGHSNFLFICWPLFVCSRTSISTIVLLRHIHYFSYLIQHSRCRHLKVIWSRAAKDTNNHQILNVKTCFKQSIILFPAQKSFWLQIPQIKQEKTLQGVILTDSDVFLGFTPLLITDNVVYSDTQFWL